MPGGPVRQLRRAAALAAAAAAAVLGCSREPQPPNLLLVTLDTLRADHLHCYGYPQQTSPNLDLLAEQAVVHTRAYSTSSWTLPAHASLFTGRYPSSHGARLDRNGPLHLADAVPGAPDLFRAGALSAEVPTLAEILAERGFDTGAVVGGPWLRRIFGLDRGFAHYDDQGMDSVKGRIGADLTDAAVAWLEARNDDPFFLFLNYYDPHTPYDDPHDYVRRFLPEDAVWPLQSHRVTPKVLRAMYDGEVFYTDEQLGRLFEALKRLGRYDDSWIVVTSDHGELLGEHAERGHGKFLFEEEIHVPLIVKHPADRQQTGRSEEPVQLTDVFVKILEGYGLPLPAGTRPRRAGDPVYAEVYPLLGNKGDWRTLMSGDQKLHWNSLGRHRLHDVAHDPGERRNLATRRPRQVEKLTQQLDGFVQALPTPPEAAGEPRKVDPSTQRALRELGYLE